jgi:hypothetical protein
MLERQLCEQRYAAWFHELDAWTEYWDIYHPETRGRFYFGDGHSEEGLLTRFLPRERRPLPFIAWTHMALSIGTTETFQNEIRVPAVASAVIEVDVLVARLFAKYFGDPADNHARGDYLEAMFRCGGRYLAACHRTRFAHPQMMIGGSPPLADTLSMAI